LAQPDVLGAWPAPAADGRAPAGVVVTAATRAAAAIKIMTGRNNHRGRRDIRQAPSQANSIRQPTE
jgi:hypothetical protein